MSKKERQKKEKKLINFSLVFSAVVILIEFLLAFVSKSNTLMMDSIFDIADLILVGILALIIPLIYVPVTEKRPFGGAQIESVFVIIKNGFLLLVTLYSIISNIQIILEGGREDLDYNVIVLAEVLILIISILVYIVMAKATTKELNTPVIQTEILTWKQNAFWTFGVGVAFFMERFFGVFHIEFITPYLDPGIAIFLAIFMIYEPIELIISSLKNILLIAPNTETVEDVKKIIDKEVNKTNFEVTFHEVIQTGRKLWIDVYFKSTGDVLNVNELKCIKQKIEKILKRKFDEIYIEFTPDI